MASALLHSDPISPPAKCRKPPSPQTHGKPPKAAATKALLAMKTQFDDFHVHGREAYWLVKTRQSESTFFKVGFEKVLGVPVTVRNMNTIVRLAAKYALA